MGNNLIKGTYNMGIWLLFSCSVNCQEQTPQAICTSKNLLEVTPESVGNNLKEGTYSLIIWLFNSCEFYMTSY